MENIRLDSAPPIPKAVPSFFNQDGAGANDVITSLIVSVRGGAKSPNNTVSSHLPGLNRLNLRFINAAGTVIVGPKPGIKLPAMFKEPAKTGRLTCTPFSVKSLNIHFCINPSPG